MTGIIDLRETAPGQWQAKYQGNYGIYAINITIDGKTRTAYSCTCPSERDPCKHIGIIEDAIFKRANTKNKKQDDGITPEKLLEQISDGELREFVRRRITYNDEARNAFLLEFADRVINKLSNKYAAIIKEALSGVHLPEEYYYDEMAPQIPALDMWTYKANDCFIENKIHDAMLISQTCIEELRDWVDKHNMKDEDYYFENYYSNFFEVLTKCAEHDETNKKPLFDFCFAEISKARYGEDILNYFYDALGDFTDSSNEALFLELQQNLLAKLPEKEYYERKTILDRILKYYKLTNNTTAVNKLLYDNIQIEDYRKTIVEELIDAKNYKKAKQIIYEITGTKLSYKYEQRDWFALLLKIAQLEHNIIDIRSVSSCVLKYLFSQEYYDVHKSTFSAEEWQQEYKKLLSIYDSKEKKYNMNAAALIAAEGDAEQLLEYIESHPCIEQSPVQSAHIRIYVVENYYTKFSKQFPERTLRLFRDALDEYAEHFMGRDCYSNIVADLKKMKRIKGGADFVKDMILNYRVRYKKRRAMLEMLDEV